MSDAKQELAKSLLRGKTAPRPAGKPAEPAAAEQPWEEPIPLPGLPDVLPFPLDELPGPLADYVAEVGAATNTPPDYAAAFALAVAAGSIGATRAVSIKEGHVQRSSLYVCAVAPKGSGKSPALDIVCDPVYEEQARMRSAGDKRRKAFVADVTAEKLAEILSDNPRGTLMVRDELASWMAGFNQYKAGGKGSDRQFFLSAWSGATVSVDRKNKEAEPIFVRYPCLTVVGTIQPSVLDRFKSDADDGFYDRVLFCIPDELPLVGEQWRTVDQSSAHAWAEAVRWLRSVSMHDDALNGARPYFLHLDDGAKAAWEGWTNDIAAECNAPDADPIMRGPTVKLAGYAARLALVSNMLAKAYQEKPFDAHIDAEDMRRGVSLGVYFLSHARRAWAAVGCDATHGPTRRLVRWIAQTGVKSFTRRDAHRMLHRVFPTSDALTAPLGTLVQHGFLRYAREQESPQGPANGRPTTTYEVHPEFCQRVNRVNASPTSGRDSDTGTR
jgi:hypothetical protein